MTDTPDVDMHEAPQADHLTADDFAAGPRTLTIHHVERGPSPKRPVAIYLTEIGPERPWLPPRTVRRLITRLWGPKSSGYAGRRVTLYRDPKVRWAGKERGGIRISHADGIDKTVTMTYSNGQSGDAVYTVDPLAG